MEGFFSSSITDFWLDMSYPNNFNTFALYAQISANIEPFPHQFRLAAQTNIGLAEWRAHQSIDKPL